MKRIYLAGKYSDSNVLDVLKNIGRGEKMAAKLFSLGYYPFSPWFDRLFIQHRPDDEFTVEQFYKYSLAWLEVSDAMLVLPGYLESKGTLAEIEKAESWGIPVYYNLETLLRYEPI